MSCTNILSQIPCMCKLFSNQFDLILKCLFVVTISKMICGSPWLDETFHFFSFMFWFENLQLFFGSLLPLNSLIFGGSSYQKKKEWNLWQNERNHYINIWFQWITSSEKCTFFTLRLLFLFTSGRTMSTCVSLSSKPVSLWWTTRVKEPGCHSQIGSEECGLIQVIWA